LISNSIKKQLDLLEKIEEKQKLLDEYQDLPPNICLANEKIDQIQQESVSDFFCFE